MAHYRIILPTERVVCALKVIASQLIGRLQYGLFESDSFIDIRKLPFPRPMSDDAGVQDVAKAMEAVA